MTFPRFDRGHYWYLIVIFGKWQLTPWSLHDAHRAVVIILFTNQDLNRGPGRRTVVEERGDLVCTGLPQDPSG